MVLWGGGTAVAAAISRRRAFFSRPATTSFCMRLCGSASPAAHRETVDGANSNSSAMARFEIPAISPCSTSHENSRGSPFHSAQYRLYCSMVTTIYPVSSSIHCWLQILSYEFPFPSSYYCWICNIWKRMVQVLNLSELPRYWGYL